jgi:multimeric flavodoxin WrbA
MASLFRSGSFRSGERKVAFFSRRCQQENRRRDDRRKSRIITALVLTLADEWSIFGEPPRPGKDRGGRLHVEVLPMKITAIVGSYRKGGIIDTVVDEILSSAEEFGAEATKIYLTDAHIEFCTNCRTCTGREGKQRGTCPLHDDMAGILDRLEQSDAIVLASPVNFGTVTAVMKRFSERLICYMYWPWGKKIPKVRDSLKRKRAVLVTSSAAPAFLTRIQSASTGLLKRAAALLGATTTGVLTIGFAATRQRQIPGDHAKKKARLLGKKLAGG